MQAGSHRKSAELACFCVLNKGGKKHKKYAGFRAFYTHFTARFFQRKKGDFYALKSGKERADFAEIY